MKYMPPELTGNYCHIAPEWEGGVAQKLWFVSAPYGGTVLRFQGEPTSLLYAISPVIEEIYAAEAGKHGLVSGLKMRDVALLNPAVASEPFYSELEARLRRQELRAICISNLTAGCVEARRIAALAKRVNPQTITILGGPHEDDMKTKTAADPDFEDIVDFSVAGDGEYALLVLCQTLFQDPRASSQEIKEQMLAKRMELQLTEGKGAVYFRHQGRTHQLSLSGKPVSLDRLPRMPRELLHEADTRTFSVFRKNGRNVKTAQIMTHRGCPWRCSFCSESAKFSLPNYRSLESVMREIEEVRRFKETHPHLDRENYEAVFFDDSTFTGRSARRVAFLRQLYARLKQTGLEWGCQTRFDQLDEEILREMKRAGCTYVFTGLESASEEMLLVMKKEEGRRHLDNAFDAINRVGIRMGISLLFGVAEHGSDTTPETRETILETLDFVRDQTRYGNIVSISPNVATYYPATAMTDNSYTDLDFRYPMGNVGYPWNRFEEGESFHPTGLDTDLAEFIIQESIKRFGEYMVEQDIYSMSGYQDAYRTGELEQAGISYVDLNHASITRPAEAVWLVAKTVADFKEVTSQDHENQVEEARERAAILFGLAPEQSDRIVLTRNATEAAALSLWISGVTARPGSHVLTTNAENLSIPRAFRFHMDHGNPQGRDMWSSFQDYGVLKPRQPFLQSHETGLNVQEIDVLSDTSCLEKTILSGVKEHRTRYAGMTEQIRLVAFCHVIRDDGTICDVAALCRALRKEDPEVFILVDGAQALGALPQIDVPSLGCDFYVAAPHKTIGSYPLGLLYMSERARSMASGLHLLDSEGYPRCIVMEGMFAPRLQVTRTVEAALSLPEILSFSTAIDVLTNRGLISGAGCQVLDQHRSQLRDRFLYGLRSFQDVQIVSGSGARYSNFLLTFRFRDRDNRQMVERLWQEKLVFLSYIARSNVMRVSFGAFNTLQDIENALMALTSIHATSPPSLKAGSLQETALYADAPLLSLLS